MISDKHNIYGKSTQSHIKYIVRVIKQILVHGEIVHKTKK